MDMSIAKRASSSMGGGLMVDAAEVAARPHQRDDPTPAGSTAHLISLVASSRWPTAGQRPRAGGTRGAG